MLTIKSVGLLAVAATFCGTPFLEAQERPELAADPVLVVLDTVLSGLPAGEVNLLREHGIVTPGLPGRSWEFGPVLSPERVRALEDARGRLRVGRDPECSGVACAAVADAPAIWLSEVREVDGRTVVDVVTWTSDRSFREGDRFSLAQSDAGWRITGMRVLFTAHGVRKGGGS